MSGIIQLCGYSFDNGQILSIMGCFQLFCFFYVCILAIILIKLHCFLKDEKKEYIEFLSFQIIVNLGVLIITQSSDFGAITRYVWLGISGVLLLPAVYFTLPNETIGNRIVVLACCIGILIISNVNLILSYYPENRVASHYKEGGYISDYRNATSEMRAGYLDFLITHGYSYGYATFWNANISTVLSEDAITITSVRNDSEFSIHPWLTQKKYEDLNMYFPEFVLLLKEEYQERENLGFEINGELIYEDDIFMIFSIIP